MAPPADTAPVMEEVAKRDYKYGFVTDIDSEFAPKGLSEDIVRFISAKKNEPEWMLEWRLTAYQHWLTMNEPNWAFLKYQLIDFRMRLYYTLAQAQRRPTAKPRRD